MVRQTSLRIPDSASWHSEPGYSPAAASAIGQAYTCLKLLPGGSRAYMQAYAYVFPFARSRISLRQRLNIVYILSMVYAAIGEHLKAFGCLDEALELSLRLGDVVAPIELFYLRGSLNRTHSRFVAAVSDFMECLEFLQGTVSERLDPDDLVFAAHVLIDKAIAHFFLAQFPQAEDCLKSARSVIPWNAGDKLIAANLLWAQALLDRQRGHFERALESATQTRHLYTQLGSPLSEVRIRFLCGNIALDLAERERASVRLAEDYVRFAQSCTAQTANTSGTLDPSGQGLDMLLRARLGRATQAPTVDPLKLIGDTICKAEKLSDSALLCQAYSALGEEQSARGQSLGAMNSFRQALDVAKLHSIPALATPAFRFFEMSVKSNGLGSAS